MDIMPRQVEIKDIDGSDFDDDDSDVSYDFPEQDDSRKGEICNGIVNEYREQRPERCRVGGDVSLLCNEKYRNIINKLSGVIGGKHHGGLSDGNNNPAVFGDDDTVRAIKATLIDCPQKLDRTGRPKCKVSDSLANAIKKLEKSIPAGNCQVTHNEADFGYEVARPFVAGQQSSSTKSCDLQLAGHSQSASAPAVQKPLRPSGVQRAERPKYKGPDIKANDVKKLARSIPAAGSCHIVHGEAQLDYEVMSRDQNVSPKLCDLLEADSSYPTSCIAEVEEDYLYIEPSSDSATNSEKMSEAAGEKSPSKNVSPLAIESMSYVNIIAGPTLSTYVNAHVGRSNFSKPDSDLVPELKFQMPMNPSQKVLQGGIVSGNDGSGISTSQKDKNAYEVVEFLIGREGLCRNDGKWKRHATTENQILNQVLVELTNPQQSGRPMQPSPRKERLSPVRSLQPQTLDSKKPLFNLNQLQQAIHQETPALPPRKPPTLTTQKQTWFFGAIDRNEAAKRLKNVKKDGTFLVRNSRTCATNNNTTASAYSMSIYYQGDVRHLKIEHKDDGFHLGTSEMNFDNVQNLVAYFQRVPIEMKNGGETKLTGTVPKG